MSNDSRKANSILSALRHYFEMNSVQYRQFLVKVKQDFLEKLRVNKVARLTLEVRLSRCRKSRSCCTCTRPKSP